MLLVLVLGVGVSFAADSNQTGLQASDDTDTVVSITETNTVSSNDADMISSINTNDSDETNLLESLNVNKSSQINSNTKLGLINENNELNEDQNNLLGDVGGLEDRDFYISPTGTGLGKNINDCTNITFAFNNIAPNHKIFFTSGTYYSVSLTLNKSVDFIGLSDNVFISGNISTATSKRFFNINTANITISYENLKFVNLNTTVSGGVLWIGYGAGTNYDNYGIVRFNNCLIENVTTSGAWGAAIAASSRNINMTITKTTFRSCMQTNRAYTGSCGPAMTINGDWPLSQTNPYYLIEDCLFENCLCNGSDGGAMRIEEPNVHVVNCIFRNNAAPNGPGGAINIYADASIINCTFINNTAGFAGAISYHDFEARRIPGGNITGCIFINNYALNDTTIHKVMGGQSHQFGRGGAIWIDGANTNVVNSTFSNCGAPYGGAIYFNADYSSILNSNFTNNYATLYGGAVYSNAKNSLVDNCKFENNTAEDGSNFYASAGNSIEITNCGFDLFYVSDDGTGDGLRMGAPTSFRNAVDSIEEGGRIYLIGTFAHLYNQRVEKSVNIEGYNNVAVVNLLGLNNRAFTISASDVTVKGITFKNSKITGDGGAIYWTGANGKVGTCTFDNNTATNGGAIYWTGAKGNITSSTFTKNTATANGGAVYFTGNNSAIESSTFTNNKAVYGSAVFLSNAVSTFEIKDTSFTSNVASTAGTVAAEKLTKFSLGGDIFTSNTATTAGTNEYYFYENTPVITSNLVYVSPSGSATSNGLSESTPTTLDHAVDSIIEDGGQIVLLAGNYNFARTINNRDITFVGRTGAVITGSRTNRVFTITGSSKIVFDGLTFSGLSFGSTSVDGAISVSSSNVNFTGCQFKTVTGSNLASVIAYDASSSGNIVGSTFTSNTATNLVNINGNVNVKDSSFTSNGGRTSSVSYNSGSKGTISGTTFSSNSGTYRNLYVNSNNVAVTGNTFDTTVSFNSVGTVIYPNNVALSGTFNTGSNYAFSGISAKNGNTVVATGSVSGNTYSATWTKPLPGTYTLTLANADNKGNTFNYASTPTVSVPVRLTTVYIGPSATGAKTGIDTNNLATWNDVAGILTTDGTVVFTAGTYSNFYGKTVSNSWKLTGSGSVTLDAGNNGRIFTISANNVQISGLTFKNGKATDSYGSAIHWTGTGGSITNSVLTANTGRPITATNTVSISNSQLKDQISLTKSNINWGATETITGTFAHSAPSKVTILFNGASQGEYTVSSSKVTASYAYTNTATRSVGSYVVSLTEIDKFYVILWSLNQIWSY